MKFGPTEKSEFYRAVLLQVDFISASSATIGGMILKTPIFSISFQESQVLKLT
jgi:hypothetical protein